jgi:hypothetical protein
LRLLLLGVGAARVLAPPDISLIRVRVRVRVRVRTRLRVRVRVRVRGRVRLLVPPERAQILLAHPLRA